MWRDTCASANGARTDDDDVLPPAVEQITEAEASLGAADDVLARYLAGAYVDVDEDIAELAPVVALLMIERARRHLAWAA